MTGAFGAITFPLCYQPPPATSFDLVAQGPAPGGPFVAASGLWLLIIAWDGAAWQCDVRWGGGNYRFAAPFVWDTGSLTMKATGEIDSGQALPCHAPADVEWETTYFAVDMPLRNYLDERLSPPPGGPILSFSQDFIPLEGMVSRNIYGGSLLWSPDHVRGLTYKLGSQVGPRALPQGTRINFGPT